MTSAWNVEIDWVQEKVVFAYLREVALDTDLAWSDATGGAGQIVADLANDKEPSWSPASDRVVYVRNGSLRIVDRDGGNDHPIENQVAGVNSDPDWGFPLPPAPP